MAAVGLGNMTKTLFGTTLMYGVNGGIETFVSQAAGAKQYKLAGIYLNQGRLILMFTFVPICYMLLSTESIMNMLGQNPHVAKNA